MLRRRYESGADRRRDACDVAEGAVPRYVDVPPGARARAAPARAAHRAPEPAGPPAREPAPCLPAPPSYAHAARLRGRPLPKPRSSVPTASNVDSTDNDANQTVLWTSFPADWGDACKETLYFASSDGSRVIFARFLIRYFGPYFLLRKHQSYVVDVQYFADGIAYRVTGRLRVCIISCYARIHDVTIPDPIHVPNLPVLSWSLN